MYQASLDGTNGFIISGVTTGNGAGGCVASFDDINGDGINVYYYWSKRR
ncbi:MAG: hypothetical protein MRQ13_01600 [Candidatus Midichloria sp.]|nr:hypothetical protein [Candidatus Midichloria sp.]